jgi:hypothetical protein
MSPTRRIVAIPLLAVVLGLAACSGGDRTSSSASQAAGGEAMPSSAPLAARTASPAAAGPGMAADSAAANGSDGAGSTKAGTSALPGLKLVKTADIVVQVDVLKTSAARVRAIAEAAGGGVASETTSYSDQAPTPTATVASASASSDAAGSAKPDPTAVQPGESVLVLRIPVAAMDRTIEQVAAVGTELSRTSSSLDVTADLADLGSRVKTQQASVDRVRALLAKAESLQNIVLLEGELTRRESDLEALEARQAALAGRADMSTLTATLRTPAVKPPAATNDNGFVSGLRHGWRAVAVSTGVVLTVLGAMLPLLVLAALIGGPLWWFLRRRAAGRAKVPTPPTSTSPPSPTP